MNIESEFFRALVLAAVAYAGLALMVRFSRGKTLAKMNAFELFTTVGLSAFLVSGILRPEYPVTFFLAGEALLVGLQLALTAVARRLRKRDFFAGEPALLFRRGHFLRGNMRRFRVSEDEVVRALRAGGWKNFHEVEAALLETDGTIAVFGRNADSGAAREEISSRGA